MLRAGVAGSKQSWHATKRLPAEPSVAHGIASTAGIYKERRAGKARPRVGCCMQRVESVFADRHYVQPGVENAASAIVSANTPPCCCAFGHYSDEREQEVDDFRDTKEGGKKAVLGYRGTCMFCVFGEAVAGFKAIGDTLISSRGGSDAFFFLPALVKQKETGAAVIFSALARRLCVGAKRGSPPNDAYGALHAHQRARILKTFFFLLMKDLFNFVCVAFDRQEF